MSDDHSADRARLLEHVPADGTAIGNTALMRALVWREHSYWYARDSLLEEGTIARARGRGRPRPAGSGRRGPSPARPGGGRTGGGGPPRLRPGRRAVPADPRHTGD